MIVHVGNIWLPVSSIKEISDAASQFVAPKLYDAHALVALNSGDYIRLVGWTAEQVARDVNRQVAEAYREGQA